ncbi:hypothetical protein ACWGJB_03305 [Streptomyces sp. NPDC054813]
MSTPASEGWEPIEEHGRKHPGRKASKGWDEDAAAENDRLREALREAAATVSCHEYWKQFKGPEAIAARQALKHAALVPEGAPDSADGAAAA